MKTLTTLLCLALFISCKNQTDPVITPDPGVKKTAMTNNCGTICPSDGIGYQISDACANCMINAYQNSGGSHLNPSDIKGWEIQYDELVQIMSNIPNPEDTKIFAMVGMKDSLEIVFQIQKQVMKKGNVVIENDYYDFTTPCPDSCPDGPN